MSLPLVCMLAGRRQGRSISRFGTGVLLLVLLPLLGARADEPDPFSATVHVDATADTAAAAREAARLDGQRRALSEVVDHLTGGPTNPPADQSRLARLDDRAITDAVLSFEVANERMSAVHYLADYTFHFRPAEVKRLMRSAGLAIATPAKPAVLLPVYQAAGQEARAVLWDDPNPWRDAWAQRPAGAGPARWAVPLADAGDLTAIDADQARAGNAEALNAISRKNGAEEAIVALATMRSPAGKPLQLEVSIKRYRFGQPVDAQLRNFDANPGESAEDLLRRAAEATAQDLEGRDKKSNPARYDQQGTLTAVVAITGLDDWIQIRDRLAGLPAIRKVALMLLTRQEATIEIEYLGSIEQLKANLVENSFDLVRGDPLWRLARNGATPSR
ncbi:MAG: DUF2066 domain-containing protein [Alphaproteobacteria bacterium]|nr:DUF2066 domain-containing protein [Alphaproteobacteria bacterium]